MTWWEFVALAVGVGVGSYLLGFVQGGQAVYQAWQRHESVHGRGWPPIPRPILDPPPPPPPKP